MNWFYDLKIGAKLYEGRLRKLGDQVDREFKRY